MLLYSDWLMLDANTLLCFVDTLLTVLIGSSSCLLIKLVNADSGILSILKIYLTPILGFDWLNLTQTQTTRYLWLTLILLLFLSLLTNAMQT